jgi:hypothetical protein
MIVWSSPAEGADDAEYNRWYDNVHVRDVLDLEGFTSCRRFRVANAQFGLVNTPGRYFAIYETDVEDLSCIPDMCAAAVAAGEMPMRWDLFSPGDIVLLEPVSELP